MQKLTVLSFEPFLLDMAVYDMPFVLLRIVLLHQGTRHTESGAFKWQQPKLQKTVSQQLVYRGYLGIMENEMETTI